MNNGRLVLNPKGSTQDMLVTLLKALVKKNGPQIVSREEFAASADADTVLRIAADPDEPINITIEPLSEQDKAVVEEVEESFNAKVPPVRRAGLI